jgi:hypothetical protein
MFEKHDRLPVTVERLTFRRKNAKEKDPTRFAEITVETELTRTLARDISADMDMLFDARGRAVSGGATEVGFVLPSKAFVMRIHPTERGKAQSISGVTVRNLRTMRDDSDTPWRVGFTLRFVFGVQAELETVLDHLFKTIFITLEEQEPSMLTDDAEHDAAFADAEKDE